MFKVHPCDLCFNVNLSLCLRQYDGFVLIRQYFKCFCWNILLSIIGKLFWCHFSEHTLLHTVYIQLTVHVVPWPSMLKQTEYNNSINITKCDRKAFTGTTLLHIILSFVIMDESVQYFKQFLHTGYWYVAIGYTSEHSFICFEVSNVRMCYCNVYISITHWYAKYPLVCS